jgi:hypothetical protein
MIPNDRNASLSDPSVMSLCLMQLLFFDVDMFVDTFPEPARTIQPLPVSMIHRGNCFQEPQLST